MRFPADSCSTASSCSVQDSFWEWRFEGGEGRISDSPLTANTSVERVSSKRFVELLTDRCVHRFLLRLFLRDAKLNSIYLVAPYIGSLEGQRFSLRDLREKVERERISLYVVTRMPEEPYQVEAMTILKDSPWIEVRYNNSVHAKVYIVTAERDADCFALFGSGNWTAKALQANIELAMLVYNEGPGREILRELHYWASVRLRTLPESVLVQRIRSKRS